nr:hypothetical protein CFP56_25846 [Quercus suber]
MLASLARGCGVLDANTVSDWIAEMVYSTHALAEFQAGQWDDSRPNRTLQHGCFLHRVPIASFEMASAIQSDVSAAGSCRSDPVVRARPTLDHGRTTGFASRNCIARGEAYFDCTHGHQQSRASTMQKTELCFSSSGPGYVIEHFVLWLGL